MKISTSRLSQVPLENVIKKLNKCGSIENILNRAIPDMYPSNVIFSGQPNYEKVKT